MLAVICRECWEATRFSHVAPKTCPKCGKDPRWMPLPAGPPAPKKAYRETRDDIKFLRSLKILPAALEKPPEPEA